MLGWVLKQANVFLNCVLLCARPGAACVSALAAVVVQSQNTTPLRDLYLLSTGCMLLTL